MMMFKSILQWSTVFLAPVGLFSIIVYVFNFSIFNQSWVQGKVKHIEAYANTKIKQGRGGRSCRKIKIHAKISYPKDYDRDCFKKLKLEKILYGKYREVIINGEKRINTSRFIYGVYRCESQGIITELYINPTPKNTRCSVSTFYVNDNIPIGEASSYDKIYGDKHLKNNPSQK